MADNSNAEKHEYRVRRLLKSLGFQKVKGGNDFAIGGNQIDAIGICDGKIVVAECTTIRSNHKDKIQSFITSQTETTRGLKAHDDYKEIANKKGSIRYVYIPSYSVSEELEKKFSKEEYNLTIWNTKLLNYYEDIAKDIPSRAKYDVLADLGFSMSEEEEIVLPALRYKQNNMYVYSFYVNPADLLKVSYVPRRKRDDKKNYQRMVDPKRLRAIEEKFQETGASSIIPTNVVIAVNDDISFKRNSLEGENENIRSGAEVGLVKLPRNYSSCVVIDGQHRLFAFSKPTNKKLPVVAMTNIDKDTQMRYFVDINREAKPIKSGLLWDLQGDLNPNGVEGIISNSVKYMNKREPLHGEIATETSSGKIKMTAVCTSIEKAHLAKEKLPASEKGTFAQNPLYSKSPNEISKSISDAISEYISSINKNVTNEKVREFIFDSGGVSVLIYLYRILLVIDQTKSRQKINNEFAEAIANFLNHKNHSQINYYKKSCSSEAGKSDVLQDLLAHLVDYNENFANYRQKREDNLDDSLRLFEEKLTSLMSKLHRNSTVEHLEKMVNDKKTIHNIKRRMKGKEDTKSFIAAMTLGEKMQTFKQSFNSSRNILEPYLLRDEAEDVAANDERYLKTDFLFHDLDRVNDARRRHKHTNVMPGEKVTSSEKTEIIQKADRLSRLMEEF